MEPKPSSMEKDRQRALGEILTAECKSDNPDPDNIIAIIQAGADVNFNNCKPLYWAAKRHKFETVKLLIKNGALNAPIARTYISSMCDYKGFNDEFEPMFFEILDFAHSKTGDYMSLFIPYINNMAVNGRLDKLNALIKRYYLTEHEVAEAIYIRIIFEIILNNHDDMLNFIEKHNRWMTQEALDLAVSSGEWVVLEYILENSPYNNVSERAVACAIYEGYLAVLDMLVASGLNLKSNPLYLEKACRACINKGTRSIEYLFSKGYSASDCYNGRTVYQNAVLEKNTVLQNWLKNNVQ